MIFKKNVEEKVEEVNPYEWPESYYMETDPLKRKALLEARMAAEGVSEEEQALNQLRLELWNLRYETMRNKKIRDCFIAGWMELIIIKNQVGAKFGRRGMIKTALKAYDLMALTKEAHFGRDLLLEELKHTCLLYVFSSLADKQYNNIALGFGKMKKEKVNAKINNELIAVGWAVPEDLELVKEAELLTEAIKLTQKHMGY